MKKQSQTSKVQKLWAKNPTMTARDMAKELDMPLKRVYVLRNLAKKKLGSNVTNKSEWKAVSVSTSNKPALDNTKYILSLETQVLELEKLHNQWRQNYKKLEDDYTQAKIMYLDSQAVITYLEEKVVQLIEG